MKKVLQPASEEKPAGHANQSICQESTDNVVGDDSPAARQFFRSRNRERLDDVDDPEEEKSRKPVRRPTPALSATASALGESSPALTSSIIASTMRRRDMSARRRRPSVFS